jgi:acyl-coenzyme A thioesterase PaaI-like protein
MRWGFNLWPCYRGTGGRVTFIAGDWREVRVRLPLSWRTRNYVGTIFGGSLYGAVDPFFMIMLMENLGPDVVVWDKAAAIRFRKPGRSALHASFRLEEAELAEIRRLLPTQSKVDRTYMVQLVDAEGVVHADVEKVIHISLRKPS